MQITYEVVACCTLRRGGESVSLVRGAKLKLDLTNHDFDDRQLQRAIDAGKLRVMPLRE